MRLKTLSSLLLLSILAAVLCQKAAAQKVCSGADIFREKNCAGDELDEDERELFRLINEYRRRNRLREIPLSDKLNLVANRHLLDLNLNLKYLTHSWSDCEFNEKDRSTFKCIFDAPKRFFPDFAGSGYENVYYNSAGKIVPAEVLEAWKKSPLHNSVLLNSGIFKNSRWDIGGIAISGRYAAVWFASTRTGQTRPEAKRAIRGLGISFEEAVKNLTGALSIDNVSETIDSKKWVGTSADKTAVLEIYGRSSEISEGRLAVRVRLQGDGKISGRNRELLGIFLENLAADWKERESWLDASIAKLLSKATLSVSYVYKDALFELGVDKKGFLTLTAAPRPLAVEF
jgi:hypothetical protein